LATIIGLVCSALSASEATRATISEAIEQERRASSTQMYVDLGLDVVATAGLSCANTMHIAHLPDWAKEKAIVEHLATSENKLDAVVQVGTNMSLSQVSEKLEPELGIPVLGINAVMLWYALRENGFAAPIARAGMLLRDH
jgi:maleate isomerase